MNQLNTVIGFTAITNSVTKKMNLADFLLFNICKRGCQSLEISMNVTDVCYAHSYLLSSTKRNAVLPT